MADVIPSVHDRLIEWVECGEEKYYVSLFVYAKGMLICVACDFVDRYI